MNDINDGIDAAIYDFVSGIFGLAFTLAKIDVAIRVAVVTAPFGITPQWVKDTGKETIEGVQSIAQILRNPGRALASLGQQVTDTVEEKGITYALSYVTADIAIGILVDKGIGKIRGLDKADDLAKLSTKVDDVVDVADDLGDTMKVVDKIDDVADVVDDVADITKAADKVDDVARIKILSSEEAEELAFNAIKGPDKADSIVLGKFDAVKDELGNDILDVAGNRIPSENSYNIIAKNMDAQYFELDNWNELADIYSNDEIWKINEKFLDIQIGSGREIYLTANPADFIDVPSFYSKELKYLQEHGYRFVKEGDLWHAVQ